MQKVRVKVEDQSVQKREWKQTDEQKDGADCITFRANEVGNEIIVTRRGTHQPLSGCPSPWLHLQRLYRFRVIMQIHFRRTGTLHHAYLRRSASLHTDHEAVVTSTPTITLTTISRLAKIGFCRATLC